MIPLILHSSDRTSQDAYINNLVTQLNIRPEHIHHIEPEGREFSIAQVRLLIRETWYSQTQPRLFVLYEFDRASQEAQNALLKTLEEHGDLDQYILCVTQPYRLLATIQSRARLISLDAHVTENAQDSLTDVFESPTPPLGHPLLQTSNYEHPEDAVDMLIRYVRGRMTSDTRATYNLRELLTTRTRIVENNVTAQMALDRVIIMLYKDITG